MEDQNIPTPTETTDLVEDKGIDLEGFKMGLLTEVNEIITKAVGNRYRKTATEMEDLRRDITDQIKTIPELLSGSLPPSDEAPPPSSDPGNNNEILRQISEFKKQSDRQLQILKDELAQTKAEADTQRRARVEIESANAFYNQVQDKIDVNVINPAQLLTILKSEGAQLTEQGYVVTQVDAYGDTQSVPLASIVDTYLESRPAWQAKRPGSGTGSSNGETVSRIKGQPVTDPNSLSQIAKTQGVEGIVANLLKSV